MEDKGGCGVCERRKGAISSGRFALVVDQQDTAAPESKYRLPMRLIVV
jgi:hypothetical protein